MNLRRTAANLKSGTSGRPSNSFAAATQLVPHWNAARRELVVDGQVVKRFRLPAPNQEAVLAAFQEEGWPPRVFDPLPPQEGLQPKRRLHETIKTLNGHRLARIIRFCGDGTGQGVLWQWDQDHD